MATHSSVLAWRIPETGEPDGLPSMGSRRVGHDWSDLAAAAAVPVLRLPCGSTGKESACNAGDPGSIPRLGTSPGEGIGYLLQYSWASLVVQMVKNLLQCRRPGFDPRVEKDPLEEGMATHSSVLAWRIPGTGQPRGLPSLGSHRVGHDWSDLAVNRKCWYVREPRKHHRQDKWVTSVSEILSIIIMHFKLEHFLSWMI